MLPTFLVIGAMKAGSTSLSEYLRAHPDIFLTADKEPDYFSVPEKRALGPEWYESLFASAGSATARGEASTSYTKLPWYSGTPTRIAELLPDVRLVYLVRHPIDRIRSHYLHDILRGGESEPLADLLRGSEKKYRKYVNPSRYAFQLDKYLEHFDRDQILVKTTEQLATRPAATVADIYEFIDVDPSFVPDHLGEKFHETSRQPEVKSFEQRLQNLSGRHAVARLAPASLKRAYRRVSTRPAVDHREQAQLPPDLMDRLTAEFRGEIERLSTFLDDDFDGWGLRP